jgi:hypothetical protein
VQIDPTAEAFNLFNMENYTLGTQESSLNYCKPTAGQYRMMQFGFGPIAMTSCGARFLPEIATAVVVDEAIDWEVRVLVGGPPSSGCIQRLA